MMQNCEMSADEPAVVGTHISGGPGKIGLINPLKARMLELLAWTIPALGAIQNAAADGDDHVTVLTRILRRHLPSPHGLRIGGPDRGKQRSRFRLRKGPIECL